MCTWFVVLVVSTGYPQSKSSTATRFQFREPGLKGYLVETNQARSLSGSNSAWLTAYRDDGSTNRIELSNRLLVQVKPGQDLSQLLAGRPLTLARTLAPNTFIYQAPDAWTAVQQAHALAALPEIEACHPVKRGGRILHSNYAPLPNDPYFPPSTSLTGQWHLENRDANGKPLGVDINARSAWAVTHGEGIVAAIGDEGIELNHPDLADRVAGAPHYNFISGVADGNPVGNANIHGTAVAGLITAQSDNGIGIAGLASGTQLASWVIFGLNGQQATDEQLMDMFQYQSNVVSVQNHSWGSGGLTLEDVSIPEKIGISNAVTYGRAGLGSVIVRAAGNYRTSLANANGDGYLTDPNVIPVAAVGVNGRAVYYSNPGANVLVSTPGGDDSSGALRLFTTDRQGSLGYNQISFTNDLASYAFGSLGFVGTSGAAPQVTGIAALILSANPNLTYRDVQQILLLSSRHFDLTDPDLSTNGAGLVVSHNVGFGVPDAGYAVRLAKIWPNRPPRTSVDYVSSTTQAIPIRSTYLLISTNTGTRSIQALSSDLGPRYDKPSPSLPLVYVGQATSAISQDLHGKVALIQRGGNTFSDKIQFAANAGATFAVIFDNSGTNDFVIMAMPDNFSPIPAVFIRQTDGEALRDHYVGDSSTRAKIQLTAATTSFNVTDTMICEHVSVNVTTDCTNRSGLRLTLISPSGTVSVLQSINQDPHAGPAGWTYTTTHHFYESSYGTWTVNASEEITNHVGNVKKLDLKIYGAAITDTDHDGLDDNWEFAHFGNLNYGAKDDPDGDGYSNMQEQLLGTDPNVANALLKLDLSGWNSSLTRLSWPGRTNRTYDVLQSSTVNGTFNFLTNIAGHFPETEFFTPQTNSPQQFFQLREVTPAP